MSAPVLNEARYDYKSRVLTLDVSFPQTKYAMVACRYNIYKDPSLTEILMTHGAIWWEGYITGRQTITISGVPATYINAGVEILYGYIGRDGFFGQEGSISVPPDQIKGLSDYFAWRNSCLSKAKWKINHAFYAIRGYAMGGFIAVYSATASTDRKVTVEIECDGSTRYGDIYTVWFGSSGWMKWSITTPGYYKVEMDWSETRYWNDLINYGLYIIGRDWEGAIVCTLTIPLNQMTLIYSTKITLSAPETSYVGQPTTLSGKLEYLDIDGTLKPLSNRRIEVYVDTTKIAETTTDANGNYTQNITILRPGTYTIKTAYPGE